MWIDCIVPLKSGLDNECTVDFYKKHDNVTVWNSDILFIIYLNFNILFCFLLISYKSILLSIQQW